MLTYSRPFTRAAALSSLALSFRHASFSSTSTSTSTSSSTSSISTSPLPPTHPPGPALKFLAAATMLPMPTKKREEDAYFHTPYAMGVADGISQWAEEGIDSGEYARDLMAKVEGGVERGLVGGVPLDPTALLHAAHKGVTLPGSSTACVVCTGRGGSVRVVNVGDSGVQVWKRARPPHSHAPAPLHLREAAMLWSCIQTAPITTHGFNFPRQLAAAKGISDTVRGGGATVEWQGFEGGEVLILATDGVWDNLGEQDIKATLARFDFVPCIKYARVQRAAYAQAAAIEEGLVREREGGKEVGIGEGGRGKLLETRYPLAPEAPISPGELQEMERICRGQLAGMSAALAMASQKVAQNPTAMSPFALAAKEASKVYKDMPTEWMVGGKPDDTTVVVALVVHDPTVFDTGVV